RISCTVVTRNSARRLCVARSSVARTGRSNGASERAVRPGRRAAWFLAGGRRGDPLGGAAARAVGGGRSGRANRAGSGVSGEGRLPVQLRAIRRLAPRGLSRP